MSFGASASTRFMDHEPGTHRPVVFWEKQADAPKKVSKKGKEQKFPLRNNKTATVIEDPSPLTRTKPAKSHQVTHVQNKKATSVNNRTGDKNRLNSKKPLPPTAGTVTLTQKEFDAILETIGQLAQEADKGVNKDPRANVENLALNDKENISSLSNSIDVNKSTDKTNIPHTENKVVAVTVEKLPPADRPDYSSSVPGVVPIPELSQHTPHPPPGSRNKEATTTIGTSQEAPLDGVRKSTIGIPKTHLTKAERKRLEWERERAEQSKLDDWSPWGRPGAGAPIKDNEGNVLADFNNRKDSPRSDLPSRTENKRLNQNPPRCKSPTFKLSESIDRQIVTEPVQPYHITPRSTGNTQVEIATNNTTGPTPQPAMMNTGPVRAAAHVPVSNTSAQPAAIRSSFTIGNPAPDENRFVSAKERQRMEWLAELEKQRVEQRLRKENERNQQKAELLHDTWADRFVPYKAVGVPDQQATQPANTQVVKPPEPTVRVENAALERTQPRVNSAPPNENPSSEDHSTYIRGQNVAVDAATMKEFQEKRRKQLEHQEYIRLQIEEKERKKREEKDRRMREEQEEEEKMRKEREQLQGQLQQEKNKAKQKEETERQRLDTLRQAMEQAQEGAEREKHEKRLQKLQRAGHDVSKFHANFEAKMTPRVPAMGNTVTVDPSYIPGLNPTPRDMRIEPSYVPGLDMSPRGDPDVSYSSNRVLTPTAYRNTPHSDPNLSPRREFATQTELELPVQTKPVSRESTDIEYRGPIQQKKKVRVKSAPEELKTRSKSVPRENTIPIPPKRKAPVKITERPRWGYKNPDKKKPVKQSEKDPFYDEKIRKKEAMRSQRQEALLKMANKHSPKASVVATTVASRARSRSRSEERVGSQEGFTKSPQPNVPIFSPEGHNQNTYGHRSRIDSYRGPNGYNDSISQSHKTSSRNASPGSRLRSNSPPIPAIKHRNNPDNYNPDDFENTRKREIHSRVLSQSSHNKYYDHSPVEAPLRNTDFVPFIRSSNVLDPAHAESPMPLSREPSIMDRARKAYIQEHDPAKFGYHMDNFNDDEIRRNVGPQMPKLQNKYQPDPILNPELVTEHPSIRQNQILQQLSTLRRGLMQKKRELDFGQDTVTVAE